ncbi:MAG: SUMF1/EgtB/PvdO family nonheme iron enzyme [Candidatus Hydrogenedentes bacterium]|nr:SUMF1/EgtB/PvdO family nonheme iron enzyme [Candidatus Hydrogenedentota bacterium]
MADRHSEKDTVRESIIADVLMDGGDRPDAMSDAMLGTQLGNYEVLFVLGKGAYGAVYKARDVKLGRPVAIKFLHEFLTVEHQETFLQEAKAIAALGKHRSIVQIYEWSEYQGRNYFVLEFVGSNAAMMLRVHPKGLPLEKALQIGLESTEGLAAAHKNGIIHRDIKPANILLEVEGGNAKLADFGVARYFDPGVEDSGETPGGTPAYMAPEVIRGYAGDARSDIFSLGATLYELLCGQLPFAGRSAKEVMAEIALHHLIPLSARNADLPDPLVTIVQKCLAPDPAQRFATADLLAQALRHFQHPLQVSPLDAGEHANRESCERIKMKAFNKAEDAKKASADKLATNIQQKGVSAFRDGEAYERLNQFGHAVIKYQAALEVFQKAETVSQLIMAEIRKLKTAQRDMAESRALAEKSDAHRLAEPIYALARQEEETGRNTKSIGDASVRYRNAQKLYERAAVEARKHGEVVVVEPRRRAAALRGQLELEGAKEIAPELFSAGTALIAQAEIALPDYALAVTRYTEAARCFQAAFEAVRAGKEFEADCKPREPMSAAGIDFVWIPAGSFSMGSSNELPEETPVHEVRFRYGFWLGKYLVTQEQWEAVLGSNPSGFRGNGALPVENVSWNDAQVFLARLSALGQGHFRLPTEAEWEYACRAGTSSPWSFGFAIRELDAHAWHADNGGGRTHPVGEKLPNPWGLYDMHGNVCEWCADTYYPNYAGSPTDGSARESADIAEKTLRGGSWCIVTPECRSGYRGYAAPAEMRGDFIGLRVVREK